MKKSSAYLALIGISLLTLLFTSCAIIELIIDLLNYEYTCDGGTPRGGTTTDFNNREWCESCNNPHDIIVDKRCVATRFTCNNGTARDGSPVEGEEREHCTACDSGYALNGTTNRCDTALSFSSHPSVDGTPSANSATVSVAAAYDSLLWWVVFADNTDLTDVNGNDMTNPATFIDNASTSGLRNSNDRDGIAVTARVPYQISLTGLVANTEYDVYVAIRRTATDEILLSAPLAVTTTMVGFPSFSVQPHITTDGQTRVEITFTPQDSNHTTLNFYGVVYASQQSGLTAAQLKVDAINDGGIDRSGGSTTVPANDPASFNTRPVLSAKTTYYFYAAVEDSDGNLARSSELPFTTAGYPFMCANGTPVPNGSQVTANITNCQSCDDYYRKETDNSCVPTIYTCNGGMPVSGMPNAMDDPAVVDKNANIEKCASCTNPNHIIHNGACELLQVTALAEVSSAATANTAQVTVTASHDATLHWVVYADGTTKNSAATVISEAADASTVGFDRSGTSGVSLTATTAHTITDIDGLSANTDYTLYAVITAQGVSILSSDLKVSTTAAGVPSFSVVPAASAITQTSADISFSADESTDLYWVLYSSPQPTLTATQLKSDAIGSGGVLRSGATADTVTASVQKSITVGSATNPLIALTDYYFYAVLEDSDGNQRLSSEEMFATTGYPFVCMHGTPVPNGSQMTANITNCQSCHDYYRKETDNSCVATIYTCADGMPASGMPNAMDDSAVADKNANIEKCASCTGAHWLDGASAHCIDHGTLDANNDYGVAANGVTITCAGISVGDTFMINGTTYTKRTTTGATHRITPANATTSCTSGVFQMVGLLSGTGLDINIDGDYLDDGEYPPVSGAASFDSDITHWDTSDVTTMRGLFHGALDFKQEIGNWDVSSVTDMSNMFNGAIDFNKNIGMWTVSSVENMSGMFYDATDFNQDIGMWTVSSATDMSNMFRSASTFDKDIGMWTVSSVENMSGMFYDATFDQDIGMWTVSSVENMSNMFRDATDFNQDISGWNVSAVTNMSGMFWNATDFNQDISGWNVSAVTNMSGMFSDALSFNKNIGGWSVNRVTNMDFMFRGAADFNQDISEWCVSSFMMAPTDFATSAAIITAHLPQWGDTLTNGCPIQFRSQPAVDTSGGTEVPDIKLTPSKDGTLYWIVYNTPQSFADSAALKTAINNGHGDKRSSASGVAVMDEMEVTLTGSSDLSGLLGGETYYFYAALEDSNMDSALSTVTSFSVNYLYVCANGNPIMGISPMLNVNRCLNCHTGYAKSGDDCLTDSDSDMVADVDDNDDDNDGLIEIGTLEQLHNMRYQLDGTRYKTSTTDMGTTAGAPTATNKATNYACGSSATGTCGYELTTNLSFDSDGEGDGTWTVSGGTYTLDSGDDNDTYFDIDSGGWQPIGNAANSFTAIFEGNNHTITGLVIQRNNDELGLFGSSGNAIQNLTIKDSLVIYNGTTNNTTLGIVAGVLSNATLSNVHITGTSHIVGSDSHNWIGALAGATTSSTTVTISNSSSSADVFGNDGGDQIGGLIGRFRNGTITDAAATGAVNSGDGNDDAGGLIGRFEDGSIVTSYATGDASGGGSDDDVGGLVGHFDNGSIVASYATGAISADGSTFLNNNIGGLVGRQYNGSIHASFATGDITGMGAWDNGGGLVGHQNGGSIVASYATGDLILGSGFDNGGGLVGVQDDSSIVASYATGDVTSTGMSDFLGGLVGIQLGTAPPLTASYATGNVDGGGDSSDNIGKLVGLEQTTPSTSSSYGFGTKTSSSPGFVDDEPAPEKSTPATASGLTDGTYFTGTEAGYAWSFSSGNPPKLLYADYDGAGTAYSCVDVTLWHNGSDVTLTCGSSLLPGQ